MIWPLAMDLAERLSLFATIAFVLSYTSAFSRISARQLTYLDKLVLVALFGGMGICGTYAGISIHGALANSRVVGVMIAGLLGGPLVGAGAGLIAGLHRYFLGGYTALACGLSTVVEGILSGIIRYYSQRRVISWQMAFVVGLIGESLQMLIILLVARPFVASWELVKIIAAPMIIVNSIGIAIFMIIIKRVAEEQESIAARQAQQALSIANQTLPFLRCGLNQQSAEKTARIIFSSIKVSAVAITDRQQILAHIGLGSDHHCPGDPIQTATTRDVLLSGELKLVQTKAEIQCQNDNCRLASAVIVSLKKRDEVIGTLELYHTRENIITQVDLNLASGLAHFFSTQLELADAEYQSKLRSQAELKALQAQIHPHFLFNALNSIISLTRTNPDQARQLLIKLAKFLRYSLRKDDGPISLEQELSHVDSYLAIEETRFGNRIQIVNQVDPLVLKCLVPAFTLQPIVENALKHGLKSKESQGRLDIIIQRYYDEIKITIADNGIGIEESVLPKILLPGYGQGRGLGLAIVNERLKAFFKSDYHIHIQSKPQQGTQVLLSFPAISVPTEEIPDEAIYGLSS